jgi:hypothetical protein
MRAGDNLGVLATVFLSEKGGCMSESSDDIAVLQHHLGPQWPGSEAEGRAAMVQVLKTAHGYDHAQAEAMIVALTRAGKLCYHRFGLEEREARAAEDVAVPFMVKNIDGWYAERHRRSRNADQAGYWEIGNRRENALGRMSQIDPMG